MSADGSESVTDHNVKDSDRAGESAAAVDPPVDGDYDAELDELLNEATKDFTAPPSLPLTTCNKSEREQKSKWSDKTGKKTGGDRSKAQDVDAFEQMKKLLCSEADDLGDLLANEFQKAMMECGGAQTSNSGLGSDQSTTGAQPDDSYIDTMNELNANMEKLMNEMKKQNSKASSGANMSTGDDTNTTDDDVEANFEMGDLLNDLLTNMSGVGESGEMDTFVQEMMQAVLDKDILYPSIKELNEKYPDWLENNRSKLSQEDFEKYDKQNKLVQGICLEYESSTPESSDEQKKQTNNNIAKLMQQLSELGQPPDDLVKSIGGGGADLSALDAAQCPVM